MENDKYYWIKLKTDFFDGAAIDFLLAQDNGAQYVIIYQMLCLCAANTGGRLVTQIGDITVPFDVKKIVRETKYFDFDTVLIAIELFKKLQLVVEDESGVLIIPELITMVGSESANSEAVKKRAQRAKKKQLVGKNEQSIDKKGHQGDNLSPEKGTDCPPEYRDKSIEYRDKSIDNRYLKEREKKERENVHAPTLDEVKHYLRVKSYTSFTAERFCSYYNSIGWKRGGAIISNWKEVCDSWEHNQYGGQVRVAERSSSFDENEVENLTKFID